MHRIATLSAAALVVTLTACGGSKVATAPTKPTSRPAAEPASTPATAPSVTDDDSAPQCAAVPAAQQAAGNVHVIRSFDGGDGANPWGSLTLDGSTLYGRTTFGGAENNGVVFSIGTDGSAFKTMHTFTLGSDNGSGNQPHHDSLTLDKGVLYGATLKGGAGDHGVVFSIRRDGSRYTPLHVFKGAPSDGSQAHSDFVVVGDTLYGMTAKGGAHDGGSLFSVRTDGSDSRMLYSFDAPTGDEPHGRLALTSDGASLVGMTRKGGAHGDGVVFRFDLHTSTYRVLHDFAGGAADGATPFHGYLTRIGTALYGMTTKGGSADAGVVFRIGETGSGFTILHTFGVTKDDGKETKGSLLLSRGYLYGESYKGGPFDDGTAFRIRTDGSDYRQLAYFGGSVTGAHPYDNVAIAADGSKLYGMTGFGGAHDPNCTKAYGTIYSVDVPR
ncbi:MAG TPA: choice-of-anchor tandem repeat GloVer-containing protein [Acidimicrobiia bacterium]